MLMGTRTECYSPLPDMSTLCLTCKFCLVYTYHTTSDKTGDELLNSGELNEVHYNHETCLA